MELLKNADIDLDGKDAVVIGRSHIVGQPVSKLLIQQNATVTILHSHSKDMSKYLKEADVIVSAVVVHQYTIYQYFVGGSRQRLFLD